MVEIVDLRTYPNIDYGENKFEGNWSTEALENLVREVHLKGLVGVFGNIDGPFSVAVKCPRVEGVAVFRNYEVLVVRNTPSIPIYLSHQKGKRKVKVYVANTLMKLKESVPHFDYNAVRCVPSSRYVEVMGSKMGFGRFRDELDITDRMKHGMSNVAIEFRRRLGASIRSMIRTDEKSAVLLSGGIDSSAVAAVLREYLPGVTGYTLDCGGQDLENAKTVAKNLGIPLKTVKVTEKYIKNVPLTELIRCAEEYRPFVVDNVSGFYFLGRAAAEDGIEALFTGSGANELFGDYHPSGGYDVPVCVNATPAQRKLLIEGRKPDDPLYNKVLGSGLDRYGVPFVKTLMNFGVQSREPWSALDVVRFGVVIPAEVLIVNGRHTKPEIAKLAFPEIGVYPEKERMADGSGISKSFKTDYATNRKIFEEIFGIKKRHHNQYLISLKESV